MPTEKTARKKPQRTCIACRRMLDKQELLRVVRSPDGQVVIDETGRQAGRGAYLCREAACLQKALKSRALERALKQPLTPELKEELLAKYEAGK